MAKTTKKNEDNEITTATVTNEAPKHKYLTCGVGMAGTKPYAFHLEGYATRKMSALPEKEGMPLAASTSMAINMRDMVVLARAKGEALPDPDPEKDESDVFVGLKAVGKLGEMMANEVDRGTRLSVTGEITTYTDKNGATRIQVNVDNYVVQPRTGGKRNKRISSAPNTFFSKKDDTTVTRNMVTLLTGRVLNMGELSTSASKQDYLRCGLGLDFPVEKAYDLMTTGKIGQYAEDAPSILNLTFFGKDAETKSKFLLNGQTIAVTGEIVQTMYNNKVQYSMTPRYLTVVDFANNGSQGGAPVAHTAIEDESTHSAAAAPKAAAPAPAPTDGFADLGNEDDELPF